MGAVKRREPLRGYFERKAMGAEEPVTAHEDEPQSFGEAWRTTWSVRTVRRMLIGFGFVAFGTESIVFLSFLLFERYHLNAFGRGLVVVPSSLAAIVAGFLGGGLVDRLSTQRPGRVLWLYAIFSTVAAAGLAVVALEPPLPILIAGMSIYSFGGTLLGPALYTVTSQVVPPTIRTQGLQIFGLNRLPALLFGLPIYFILYTHHGFTSAFMLGVGCLVVGALVLAGAGKFFDLDRRNALAAAVAAEEWRVTTAAGQGKLLVCRGVEVAYDSVQVVFGVDFD